MKNLLLISVFSFLLIACQNKEATTEIKTTSDPLPSWNEGATKDAILKFVSEVTDENSTFFVPVEDRIATFDNDGNLWSEKPFYYQLKFAIDRVKELAPEHPEWLDKQPFKGAIEDDLDAVLATGTHGLLELVMATHAGMTEDEFNTSVDSWLKNNTHSRFNQPYNNLIYQPMLELLDYLRANEFTTFIVSGGGIDFIRVWGTEAYGIPTHQIIGSSLKSAWEYSEGAGVIRKTAEINFIDDHEGKPVGIHQHIGKKPIFASGNSDGDLQMLRYAASNSHPSFMLYLHHTDAEREWAYDRETHVGKLDKGLDEAKDRGWTVIDMKNDWNVIYPFQLK